LKLEYYELIQSVSLKTGSSDFKLSNLHTTMTLPHKSTHPASVHLDLLKSRISVLTVYEYLVD